MDNISVTRRQIIEEIATTIALLGGRSDILSIVSSIDDCQTDENILKMLKVKKFSIVLVVIS